MNSDPFDSPRELIAWAEEDTQELDRLVSEFFTAEPYTEFADLDPQTGNYICGVRLDVPIPSGFRKRVTCAISNLRHSFDQSIYAASVAINKPIEVGFTFPFATNPHDLNMRLAGGKQGPKIPVELHDAIRSLQPYPTGNGYAGGDDLLSKLAKVAGLNKHTVSLEFAAAIAGLGDIKARGTGFFRGIYDWDPENKKLILFERSNDPEFDHECKVVFYIAFGEVQGLQHQSIGPALAHFTARARDALNALIGAVS